MLHRTQDQRHESAARTLGLIAAVLGCALTAPALAHDFTVTEVVAVLKRDGTYMFDMRIHVDALALGVAPSTPTPHVAEALRAQPPERLAEVIEAGRETVQRRVRVRFDGQKVLPRVTFPEYGAAWRAAPEEDTVLGTTARLEGRMPDGAATFTFGASRSFQIVQLTILDERSGGGWKYTLGPGEDSPPFTIGEPRDGAAVEPRGDIFGRYLVFGFEHILPKGLDHILFVLGLFLLSPKARPLLWQVTAFTIAHSVTLGLAMRGVVTLPSSVVEPLIALSIAYVAVENIFTRDLKPWRPAIVFAFGLLHGLGFADVLKDLGMPADRFPAALIGFNLGVEAGQLAVVTLAFLAVGWFRRDQRYRNVVVRPLSGAIALVGLYWAVERAFL